MRMMFGFLPDGWACAAPPGASDAGRVAGSAGGWPASARQGEGREPDAAMYPSTQPTASRARAATVDLLNIHTSTGGSAAWRCRHAGAWKHGCGQTVV